MIPGIRYDKIFQELGCHGEHVEKPDQIRVRVRASVQVGQAGRNQRGRQQADRAPHAGRQPAGLDAVVVDGRIHERSRTRRLSFVQSTLELRRNGADENRT